jgi:NAD(P)-dependent dehydrogenase (short-subunit alcohol dehydrogenase family)
MSQRIWLTGASSGIGHSLAIELLDKGHQLVLSARSREPLEILAQRYPGQVLVAAGDLTDADQVRTIGLLIRQHLGALDCAILNAGACEYLEVSDFEAAMIERVMKSNLFTSAYCIETALPLLRRGNKAHLVAIGSSVTFAALPRAEAYGTSKAALRYLMETLRIDLASEGIAVTLVSPGFVDTPMTAQNDFPMPFRWSVEQAAREIARRLPAQPCEINFPKPFIAILRLLGALPKWLQVAIGKRLARPAGQKEVSP